MSAGMFEAVGTLLLFLSFVGLLVWAWMPRQREAFQQAALLPFCDEAALPQFCDEAALPPFQKHAALPPIPRQGPVR
ncbi:MAG TPA: cbb3-type cytochrome c oxidase subunit 3 [Candidatus Binatia bacterium]|jgi:cytochrome c oxidase cbb3-type subunit 4